MAVHAAARNQPAIAASASAADCTIFILPARFSFCLNHGLQTNLQAASRALVRRASAIRHFSTILIDYHA